MNTLTPSARTIFLDAVEKSPADWPRFLDSACGSDAVLRQQVQRLLAAHQTSGQFMSIPAAGPLSTASSPPAVPPGTMIGRYKLLEQIGEGGMGIVYVAEQTEPVRRQVALKIIKPGMDTRQVIARFEAERQALALMDHPNIARILDGGTIGLRIGDLGLGIEEQATSAPNPKSQIPNPQLPGRPYFVMELVRGLPITEYCDREQLGVRQRLALFITVCQAVQHAHQKGVIHRDLKPGNVMIALHDGVPVAKVIDFGVAKAISPEQADRTTVTSISQLIGTPLYMSPEQAELGNQDIDTRSDVYSLGVLLYELLTGTTPVGKDRLQSAGFDELRRIIREEVPETVSKRIGRTKSSRHTPCAVIHPTTSIAGSGTARRDGTRSVPTTLRELDWIAMKALEKDRNRRYESASALAADVQRYLDDEPIQAAPPSPLYLARKLVRRHVWAAASAAAIFCLLAAGVAATGWQAIRARRAELSAEQRFVLAKEAVDKYLLEVTQDEQLSSPAFQELRRKLLEAAEPFYERLSRERPADPRQKSQQAAALHRLGQVYVEIGKYPLAHPAFERAATLYEQLDEADPQSRDQWSRSPSTARPLVAALSPYARELSSVLLSHGNLFCRQGENSQAAPLLERALALRQALHAAAPADADLAHALAEAQLRLGSIQWGERGRLHMADATQLLTLVSTKHPQRVDYQASLADSHQAWATHVEDESVNAALKHHAEAVSICTRLAEANPGFIKLQLAQAVALAQQGSTLHRVHRLVEAHASCQQAANRLTQLAVRFPGRVDVEEQLGRMLDALGQTEEDQWLEQTPRSHYTCRDVQRRYSAALQIHEGLTARYPQVADFQVSCARAQAKVGEFLTFRGEADEGERLLVEARDRLQRVEQDTGGHLAARESLASVHARLTEFHVREGRRREADQEWASARALGVGGNQFAVRFTKVERALAFSIQDEFHELLRQTGGFLASMHGGRYLDHFAPCKFFASFQEIDVKRLASSVRLPSLNRSWLSLPYRQRRLNMEKLEDRSLLAGISIGDAMAIEGASKLNSIDIFVASGSGGLDRPRASTFGPDGNGDGAGDLYVPSVDTDQVLRFDGVTGAFLDVFIPAGGGGLDSPGDLEFAPDGLSLYVTSNLSNQLLRFSATDGQFLDVAANGLASPMGISRGPDGAYYIANQGTNEVLRYDGSSMSVFVSSGSGGLARPVNAQFGPDGNLYVSSTNSGSVLRYNGLSGAFLNTFASTGLGSGPLWIQFGGDGLLYATARTTTTSLDTTLLRFNDTTGVKVDSFNIGRDSWSFQIGPDGLVYLSGNGGADYVERLGSVSLAQFSVSLSSPSELPVTVNYATTNGTALLVQDYETGSGQITFAPGETTRTVLVRTVDNGDIEPTESFGVVLSNPTGASIADDTGVGTIIDNDTKFYVVDDGAANSTFEYGSFADGGGAGAGGESYGLSAGNAAPRGAASTAAGDKVWVVDANRNVYVYDAAGVLLGSWTATASGLAQPEGIATNGTDIWIVDASADKVYQFAGAASRLTGTQNSPNNANFKLNNSNKEPTDIVTDGVSFWVVNNASGSNPDKVFKYSLSGNLQGSWTILGGGGSPTGITLDPSSPSHLWIVDNATDRVYQFDGATSRTSGSQSPSTSFALAAGNTNPQGIADPPPGGGAAAYDAALLSLFDDYLASKRKRR